MRSFFIAILSLLLASCATTHMQENSTSVASKDGSTLESAIVINESNEIAGVRAEYHWLETHYPNFKRDGQGVLSKSGRMYDRINFTTSDGQKKVAYFDITGFFGKM